MTKLVDNAEVERFGALAEAWWDPRGKFRPLHQINPVRLRFLRERCWRIPGGTDALEAVHGAADAGYRLRRRADRGAAGPARRVGDGHRPVVGKHRGRAAARRRAQELAIDYVIGTSDDLVAAGRRFDCVIALEVIEHVPDVSAFLRSCAELTEPGGLLMLSTLNRTAKSFALGIVAAEYVLDGFPGARINGNVLLRRPSCAKACEMRG